MRVPYVLSAQTSNIAGSVIARDGRIGTVLLKTNGTLSLAFRVVGLYPNDVWSGPRLSYTRFRCRGGFLAVTLGSDGTLFSTAQTVTGRSGVAHAAVTFAPARIATLRLPLRKQPDGTCRATFTVAPTAVPAQVERERPHVVRRHPVGGQARYRQSVEAVGRQAVEQRSDDRLRGLIAFLNLTASNFT